MFTLPPRPPKDYVIKHVTNSLQSSSQFTPDSLPRVTQNNLAKFCSPVEYDDNEIPDKQHVELQPLILEKMTMDAKASWLPPPGKDDFTLHEVHKTYNVPPENYDPRFRNGGKTFLSYKMANSICNLNCDINAFIFCIVRLENVNISSSFLFYTVYLKQFVSFKNDFFYLPFESSENSDLSLGKRKFSDMRCFE